VVPLLSELTLLLELVCDDFAGVAGGADAAAPFISPIAALTASF
jgi:hypothetical protein